MSDKSIRNIILFVGTVVWSSRRWLLGISLAVAVAGHLASPRSMLDEFLLFLFSLFPPSQVRDLIPVSVFFVSFFNCLLRRQVELLA